MDKSIENWFKSQDFDTTALPDGHRNRFLARLQDATQDKKVIPIHRTGTSTYVTNLAINKWYKWSLVAGLALLIGLAGYSMGTTTNNDLASVSLEMAHAQDFFTNTITQELNKLESQNNPETQQLITDTKSQLLLLEDNYKNLKLDLEISGNSRTVIAAMIQNFQNRIQLLETALEHIESIKKLKHNTNETLL